MNYRRRISDLASGQRRPNIIKIKLFAKFVYATYSKKKLSREKQRDTRTYVRIDVSNFKFVARRIEVSARYVDETLDRCGQGRKIFAKWMRKKEKDNSLMNRSTKQQQKGISISVVVGFDGRRPAVAATAATKGIQPPTPRQPLFGSVYSRADEEHGSRGESWPLERRTRA